MLDLTNTQEIAGLRDLGLDCLFDGGNMEPLLGRRNPGKDKDY